MEAIINTKDEKIFVNGEELSISTSPLTGEFKILEKGVGTIFYCPLQDVRNAFIDKRNKKGEDQSCIT